MPYAGNISGVSYRRCSPEVYDFWVEHEKSFKTFGILVVLSIDYSLAGRETVETLHLFVSSNGFALAFVS